MTVIAWMFLWGFSELEYWPQAVTLVLSGMWALFFDICILRCLLAYASTI